VTNIRPTLMYRAVQSTVDRRPRKLGQVSCTQCTGKGNDFELIPAVKMEIRLPLEGSLDNKFSLNSSLRSYGDLKSQDVEKIKFLRFCPDISRRVVFKFREIWLTGNR